MSNTRYIEISSNYRDRNLWPLASEFEIPISQTGTKTINNSLDPVSLAMPIFSWTSNNFILGGNSSVIPVLPNTNTANIANPSGTDTLGYSSDSISFIIVTDGHLQQLRNYYYGLVLNDANSVNSSYRRILFSTYLGVDSTGKYRTQITVGNGFSDYLTYGDKIYIYDPTDFSDVYNPLIFVPNGAYQENAYNGYILYNETINQYRPILRYDNGINTIQLDTSGSSTATNSSGPIDASWNTTDNFSLRKEPPIIPVLGASNPTITSATLSTITIPYTSSLSTITDYYKNYFIRILPYGDTNTSPTDICYEYDPLPSNNKAYRIISYTCNSPTDATFVLSSPMSSLPSVNTPIEILPFSYDNFNPLVYTGSLVSQQEMVCYEMQLVSLTMPNATLTVGSGGRISYYPYVYVQISNVSATGAGLKNIIYSNNPNATNVIFRAPIYDIQNPLSTPFVRIDASGMTQTIKFKPNDNLYFKVTLANGETYKTILQEYYSPSIPNPMAQITALFSFKRII